MKIHSHGKLAIKKAQWQHLKLMCYFMRTFIQLKQRAKKSRSDKELIPVSGKFWVWSGESYSLTVLCLIACLKVAQELTVSLLTTQRFIKMKCSI